MRFLNKHTPPLSLLSIFATDKHNNTKMRKGPPPPIYQIKGRARVLIGEGHCITGDSSPTTTGTSAYCTSHDIVIIIINITISFTISWAVGGLIIIKTS